jgi:hypothetical protein
MSAKIAEPLARGTTDNNVGGWKPLHRIDVGGQAVTSEIPVVRLRRIGVVINRKD